jgi:hypothetical protein
MTGAADELAERAIAAHGGAQLWSEASEISVQISSGGLAFASKFQGSAVRSVDARVSTEGQHVTFTPYPRAGQRGVFEADGSVRIESDAGEVLARREHARTRFADLRHKLWWDRLDILYFGCYAMWTYVSAPFVFTRDGYGLRELEPWRENDEEWRRLEVRFPDEVHTHCREQVFHIDSAGLIRRHDYTAEPIGGWAHAAHYCLDHEAYDGLVVPTHRRVFPLRRDGRPRARPRLVWIDVEGASVIPR